MAWICPVKVNPLERIKKIVQEYHWMKDTEAGRKATCIYRKTEWHRKKEFKFDERLQIPGRFQSTQHRRVFLYSWLDTATYERECKNCGRKTKDIVKHGLEECQEVEKHRKIYLLRMKLYDAPQGANLLEKKEIFKEALAKKSLTMVLCEFLMEIWKWDRKV